MHFYSSFLFVTLYSINMILRTSSTSKRCIAIFFVISLKFFNIASVIPEKSEYVKKNMSKIGHIL